MSYYVLAILPKADAHVTPSPTIPSLGGFREWDEETNYRKNPYLLGGSSQL